MVVESCSNTEAKIIWTKGSDNNAPIQYFIVQYNTSFERDQWVFSQSTVGIQTTAYISLSPWTEYTFRIIAKNKIGESEPSFPTKKVCVTDPAQPTTHPQDVRSIGDRKGYLVMEWTVCINVFTYGTQTICHKKFRKMDTRRTILCM